MFQLRSFGPESRSGLGKCHLGCDRLNTSSKIEELHDKPCRREHHVHGTVDPFRSVRGENIARGLVRAPSCRTRFSPRFFPGTR